MPSFAPQEAAGHIVDLTLIGDVRRGSILAIVLGQLLQSELAHSGLLEPDIKEQNEGIQVSLDPK
jgi:hypothetical protein